MAKHEPRASGFIWRGFLETYGPVLAVLSVLLGLLAFYVSKENTVGVGWLVLCGAASFIVILTLVQALVLAVQEARPASPVVIKAVAPYPPYDHVSALCVVATSELFPKGASLSFYVLEDEVHERCIGFGPVVLVQHDSRVLVALDVIYNGSENYVAEMLKPPGDILKRLIVRPGLDSSEVEFIGESRKRRGGNQPTSKPEIAVRPEGGE